MIYLTLSVNIGSCVPDTRSEPKKVFFPFLTFNTVRQCITFPIVRLREGTEQNNFEKERSPHLNIKKVMCVSFSGLFQIRSRKIMAILKFKLEMKLINAYLTRQTTSLNIVRSSMI